jgi:outer membrane protein assembly factor BamD (BamD/ComL family)
MTNYEHWLEDFPSNALQPQVSYALAQANFQAGNETNAFQLFTNFVAQFPASELAPLAQWWVADHFFRAGDWADAERNYKSIFQNPDWRNSPLIWQAQKMAGRAALARLGYADAIGYFTTLAEDASCPPELAVPARLAYGSTLMLMNSTVTNNPLANFQQATNVFGEIARGNPTNEWGVQAMIEAGKCDLQLNNFDAATNACAQVFNSPFASVSDRSEAQIGFGIALEKKAASAPVNEQARLLNQALDNYSDVLLKGNLRDGEHWDAFWRKKAGLQAAALAETLGNYEVAVNVYLQLEELFPQLSLEKKITAAKAHLTGVKN